ncbi:MAG: hypothetical protein H6738_23225 [Alphaproteobacteria bacterium]|nr:hypothetical protein [Alphaproteobacteria bacterium]MCB9699717.1 hypothetical protein [Alphaproteobacteria bacterium]
MYQPAFTETFVALIIVILWARWLDEKAPTWAAWLPWGSGALVGVSQIIATWIVLQQMPGDAPQLLAARWLGMGACLASMVVQAGFTARHFAGSRSS